MEDRRRKAVIGIFVFIAVALLIVSGFFLYSHFFGPDPDMTVGELEPVQGPVDLGEVEVEEYKGAKLGSMEDFRENSIKGPQYIDKDTYRLRITGLVDEERSYTYDEIVNDNQRYRKVVTLNCVEGWSVKVLWEGVLVRDVIEEAGVKEDEARVLIFKAADGYTTSLPIEFFYDRDVIMAYGMNNVTLPAERGFPFQLVAEMKWGYKWIKWITEIEVSDDINYKGYWEERGYSNRMKQGNC
jgi:DMSO/TMAO reductase YedYZ molybdopterin-dependent catalytic subunit